MKKSNEAPRAEGRTVELGWLAKPLHIQLGTPRNDLKQLQKDADAICRLKVRGYINERTRDSAYQRVLKEIPTAIETGRRQRREARAKRKAKGAEKPGATTE